jgi:hypothetical protein
MDDGGFRYEMGELSRRPTLQSLEKDIRLVGRQIMHCRQEEILTLRHGDIFSYVTDGASVCKIEYGDYRPLAISYSRSTGEPVKVNMSTIESTQLIYLMRFASQYGDADTVAPVVELSSHYHHNIRWEALKALSRLSSDDARIVLDRMQDDPHPEIRAAARRSIAASQ